MSELHALAERPPPGWLSSPAWATHVRFWWYSSAHAQTSSLRRYGSSGCCSQGGSSSQARLLAHARAAAEAREEASKREKRGGSSGGSGCSSQGVARAPALPGCSSSCSSAGAVSQAGGGFSDRAVVGSSSGSGRCLRSSSGSSSSSRAKAKELGVSGLGMSSEAVAEVLDGLGRCVGWQQHEFSGPLVWSLVGYSDPLAHLNDPALDPGQGQRQGGGQVRREGCAAGDMAGGDGRPLGISKTGKGTAHLTKQSSAPAAAKLSPAASAGSAAGGIAGAPGRSGRSEGGPGVAAVSGGRASPAPTTGMEEEREGRGVAPPNVAQVCVLVRGWPLLLLVATTQLRGGDELMLAYGRDFWRTQLEGVV